MNWTDLVRQVSAETGRSQAAVREILETAGTHVADALIDGDKVRLPHLGTFEARWHAGRVLRDVSSGRRTAIDGRRVARFVPTSSLKEALRDSTPQLLRRPEHQAAWRLAEALVGDIDLYHASKAPQDLAEARDTDEVERICIASFGDAWRRARETFDARVPREVRDRRDYLVDVARHRWTGGEAA